MRSQASVVGLRDHVRIPAGRVGSITDVAAVLFLAPPAAGLITGEHLLEDGGWPAQ